MSLICGKTEFLCMVDVRTINATELREDINSMKSAETTKSPTIIGVGWEHQTNNSTSQKPNLSAPLLPIPPDYTPPPSYYTYISSKLPVLLPVNCLVLTHFLVLHNMNDPEFPLTNKGTMWSGPPRQNSCVGHWEVKQNLLSLRQPEEHMSLRVTGSVLVIGFELGCDTSVVCFSISESPVGFSKLMEHFVMS